MMPNQVGTFIYLKLETNHLMDIFLERKYLTHIFIDWIHFKTMQNVLRTLIQMGTTMMRVMLVETMMLAAMMVAVVMPVDVAISKFLRSKHPIHTSFFTPAAKCD